MSITDEQRANLEKLAAYLEGLPADYEHFDMESYFSGLRCEREIEYALNNGGVANCGAIACAIGHGPAAGVLASKEHIKLGTVKWDHYASEKFGAEGDLWAWLFSNYWGATDNSHYGAAARIRYFLAHAIPDTFELGDDCEYSATLVGLYAPYRIDAKASA